MKEFDIEKYRKFSGDYRTPDDELKEIFQIFYAISHALLVEDRSSKEEDNETDD